MTSQSKLTEWAKALKRDTLALYLAARHPDTPWYAKALAAGIAAYALSPIDLIPDFIPVIGYLDDAVLLPLGIALAVRMIPPEVLSECRREASERFAAGRPVSKAAGAIVSLVWIAVALLVLAWAWSTFAE